MIKQSWNKNGLSAFSKLMFDKEMKSLTIPHFSVNNISKINWGKLKEAGINGIVFDRDNTLTKPYTNQIFEPIKESFEECKNVFGDRIVLFSNHAGTKDDINYESAIIAEKSLGIHVIRHDQKKPDGIEDVTKYFDCDPKLLVSIGDRYFTDILFGNMNGLLTIHTNPFTNDGDPNIVKIIRIFESNFVKYWIKKGLKPKEHSLSNKGSYFIKNNIYN
eukprot:TRINITY_DN8831_c0_g1_i1.p1 TRINITY_DN8831_c0_g1~~TRINITY_DN8831_c0_g1_i1.p1  ORF type:complete len:218 (-),score=47.50 TRINITY_DN8831_c0_g1_i1:52-705(-)